MRPKAYSYIRMSTETQLLGDSLRRQLEASTKYALEHDLELVDEINFHDIGVSAFKGVNASQGALSIFLAAIDAGEIEEGSYLLVESLDRLSRDKVLTAFQLFLRITSSGINIVTLADNQFYPARETDMGQLMYSIAVMSRANEESVTKSKRIAAAWAQKRANITQKKLTKTCPKWLILRDDRKGFDKIPANVETIRKIFNLCIDGLGTYSITRDLNENGTLPFGRTNGWNESYITKILKNRAVLGEFQPHQWIDGKKVPSGDVILDYYPRIIDDETFYLAQGAMRRRSYGASGRKGKSVPNLFSQLLHCQSCRAKMRVQNKGPKNGYYIKCDSSIRGMGCNPSGWRYDHFETAFLMFAEAVDLAKVVYAVDVDEQVRTFRDKLSAEKERLTHLELQRERAFNLYLEHESDFVLGKLTDLEAQIEQTNGLIAEIESALAGDIVAKREASGNLSEIVEKVQKGSDDELRMNRLRLADKLRQYISRIYIPPSATTLQVGDEPTNRSIKARMFTVVFKDGSVRMIGVNALEPTEWLLDSYFDGEGGAKLQSADGKDWLRNRPLNDDELDEILSNID
ncbi:MAG: recombinase family protein [Pelagibacterium sp.]|uniref:recombinase family protein n=1 Tax=Pelagibacterium sp. TaxID=1967288 RepID=UPI0032EF0EA9